MHESETDAVCEGPLFVSMPAKETSSGVEAIRPDPFQAQGFATGKSVEKVRCRGVAVPHEQ